MKMRDIALFAVIAMPGASARAQTATSRIEGIIVDPSGAGVELARVTSRSERTGLQATARSGSGGWFIFPSLLPGPYRLTVEATGFRSEVLTGISVGIAETAFVRVALQVGAIDESMTVDAEQTAVNLADAQGGGVISQGDIDALPQVERHPVRLAIFQPGVQILAGTLGQSRINGTRQGSQAPRLDGIDVSEPMAPGLGFIGVPASDSIQEVRVATHSAKAEYGRSGGAQIEMVSRSGTNRWHSTLYHFHRNTFLNANEFFNNSTVPAVDRPKLIYNSFGSTIGGPLRRDRTFFFASYSGIRSRGDSSANRLVLTPEAKAGIFRWRWAGGVQTFNIPASDPRGKGIDPLVAGDLALLPPPNNFDHLMADGLNTGGFRFNNPGESRSNIVNGRIDHSIRERLRLFMRITSFADTGGTDSAANFGDAVIPGQPPGLLLPSSRGLTLGANWAVSPRMIADFRIGRQGVGLRFERPARLEGPMTVATVWTSPRNPDFPRHRSTSINSAAGTLTFLRGSHTLKTGVELRSLRIHLVSSNGIYPNVFLGTDSEVGVPASIGPQPGTIEPADLRRFGDLYNHLLGRISRVEQTFYSDLSTFLSPGAPRERRFRAPELHGFFQDDWRLRPNLTVNLGIRYEMYRAPSEGDGLQGTLDRAASLGAGPQIADLTVIRTKSWYKTDRNDVAPRAGLVWDPTGKGKTSIRVSYGIYYDPMIGNVLSFVDQRTPGFAYPRVERPNSRPGSDYRLSDEFPLPVAPAEPVLRMPEQRAEMAAIFNPHLRTGYVQQYSVSLQGQFARGMFAEAAWVGNRGIKLLHQTMPNQRKINGGFLDAFRDLQARGIAASPENTLVRVFGSALNAVTNIGMNRLSQGLVAVAADIVDRDNYSRYAAAGLSPFYIRNYPQFNMLFVGSNDGRSYYDSLQLSLRRRGGPGQFAIHYTFSKTIDVLSNSGAAQESVIDHFNLRLNRARADFDHPHVLSGFALWTLPFGKGHRIGARWRGWVESLGGGWEISAIGAWESGSPFTVRSGRQTAGAPIATFANYSGSRNIGRVQRRGDGVYFFTEEETSQFSFPVAGEIGTAGRNTFRGPRCFNIDLALGKRFRLTERQAIGFRAEAYNLLNNPNFGNPGSSLTEPATLGKISGGVHGLTGALIGENFGGPRVVQLALRWGF